MNIHVDCVKDHWQLVWHILTVLLCCCAGIVTCLHLSDITVDWNSVIKFDSDKPDSQLLTVGCFYDIIVYMCTSYGQLVECRGGRLASAVDLPFRDAVSVVELESATRSKVFIVESRTNSVAVVDVSKRQVMHCRVRCDVLYTVLGSDLT